MRLAAAAMVALAILLTACGGQAEPSPEPTAVPTEALHTLAGTFTLHATDGGWRPNSRCKGSGGYSDIVPGMGMTLKDGEGTILGTARFGNGTVAERGQQCVFEFTFEEVPVADFYVLDSGRRGEQTYSREELESLDWTVDLEIGR